MIKLSKKQALVYQQRWERIELAQTQELQRTPMSLKFKQLCLLMNSFSFISLDKKREKKTEEVRKYWTVLKKKWRNGGR